MSISCPHSQSSDYKLLAEVAGDEDGSAVVASENVTAAEVPRYTGEGIKLWRAKRNKQAAQQAQSSTYGCWGNSRPTEATEILYLATKQSKYIHLKNEYGAIAAYMIRKKHWIMPILQVIVTIVMVAYVSEVKTQLNDLSCKARTLEDKNNHLELQANTQLKMDELSQQIKTQNQTLSQVNRIALSQLNITQLLTQVSALQSQLNMAQTLATTSINTLLQYNQTIITPFYQSYGQMAQTIQTLNDTTDSSLKSHYYAHISTNQVAGSIPFHIAFDTPASSVNPVSGSAISLNSDPNDVTGTFSLVGGPYGRRFLLDSGVSAQFTTNPGNLQHQWEVGGPPSYAYNPLGYPANDLANWPAVNSAPIHTCVVYVPPNTLYKARIRVVYVNNFKWFQAGWTWASVVEE